MNVFPFDPCPVKSAQALDDKRLWRVFTETVMMESCITGGKYERIVIHKRLRDWITGPGRLWFNAWLHAQRDELVFRFGHYGGGITGQTFKAEVVALPNVCGAVEFINLAKSVAKGLDYSHEKDVHLAYRAYVGYQWEFLDVRAVEWTRRGPPDWYSRC